MTGQKQGNNSSRPTTTASRSGFLGDVVKLVSGSVAAQLTAIVVSPILARLFLPEMFGTAAVLSSLVALISPIACLRYELAIVLPDDDRDAASLLALSIGSAAIVALLTAAAVWLLDDLILSLLKAPELAPILWLAPMLVFFRGLSSSLNFWNTRTRHFGRLSVNRVLNATSAAASKLVFGFSGLTTSISLILGNSIGIVLSALALTGLTWRGTDREIARSVGIKDITAAMARYRKFPIYSSWTAIAGTLSVQLPVLMLSANFDSNIVGYYSLGNRMVRMPMNLVGGAVAQVFFPRAAEAQTAGQLKFVVQSVFTRLVSMGLFPALLLTLVGEELFVVVFGESWATSGLYTAMLSIYMFFNFISSPLGQLISVLEKQEVGLVMNIALLSSRYLALWIGGRTGDDILTIALFSVSGVVFYGAYSLWLARASGISMGEYWLTLARTTLISSAFLAPAWVVVRILDLGGIAKLVPYLLVAVAYYIWLVRGDRQLRSLIPIGRRVTSE